MEIAEIKSLLTLDQVLRTYSLSPDRNLRLRCPWHDDKTPSLQIYPKTNTWTCFSSNCSAGSGDQIDFIMIYENISKHEAIVKAKAMIGASSETPPLSRVAILTKYYQGSLHAMQRSKKGQEYACSRGLDYEKHSIGYCGYEVGKSWNKDLQASAEKMGLYQIKNCLIFPTKNKEGQIVGIYGRAVSDSATSRHFYLSGGFKGLYPGWPQAQTTQLILTESIIDAATLRQAQGDHLSSAFEILALYGTNGFTPEHAQAIRSLELLEEVILFFDGDQAGKAAVTKYSQELQQLRSNLKISYVETPEGEDPNSLVQGHDPEILQHLIDNRIFFSIEPARPTGGNKKEINPPPVPSGKLNADNPELMRYQTDQLTITILGGIKITGLDRLRVTLKIEKTEAPSYLPATWNSEAKTASYSTWPIRFSLDLYYAKQVEQLTQKMAESLEVSTSEATRTISKLTGALENYRQNKLEQLKPQKTVLPAMTESEKREAMAYLKDPKLLRNTLTDITKSGIVGEKNNALIAYLAYTSRKREKPLHIMCLGASGTGKTYLQEKVSELIPEEDKIEITTLSDNALYYFGREELKHKLILIEDLDGAENVLYPLRELQSKRRISKTVTLKDNKGNLKTITLLVEGPVCVSGCTTREKVYEDNANRCILLYIDDSNDQDQRIMNYQKALSSGNINHQEEQQITTRFKNIQRLLNPVHIVNPFAEFIDLPEEVFKPRRTLLLLLSFIETITFYHQWQRPQHIHQATGQPFIESTAEDVEAAFGLLKEVLFSKSDELTQATRSFLEKLKSQVKDGEIFYTQDIRKKLRISSSTIHRYIRELKSHGYLKYKGGNKYRGYEYQIADYQEYDKLKDEIDQRLKAILLKIKAQRIPVSQTYPINQNGITNPQTINALI